MNKAQRVVGIFAIFGIVAAVAYWVYLYIAEGEAPSFGDLWVGAKGAAIGVTSLGKLSFSDLQQYAGNAGFEGDDLNTACAIALAESSGNPAAVGDLEITPGGSIGLWQINLKAHPEYTANVLTDPQTNANAAFAVYRARGNQFSAWSTFNNGAYAKYLPAAADQSDTAVAQNDDTSQESQDYGEDM